MALTVEQWLPIAISIVASVVIPGLTVVFVLGRRDAGLATVATSLGELADHLDKHRSEIDTRFAGTSAQIRTIETQASETRERTAQMYATNETVRAIETRFSAGQDRVLAALDKVADRVNEINNRMIDDAQREHKR